MRWFRSKQKVADNQAIIWLSKMNRSDFSEAQEAEFFIWLKASPLHQAAFIHAEQLWQRGEVLGRIPSPLESGRAVNWLGWSSAFACLLVVCAIFWWPSAPELQHYSTALGEQKHIQLVDGTELVLNTDSALTIEMDKHLRIAQLNRGEVYFHVAKDAKLPFRVMSSKGQIQVLGTRFSVRLFDDDLLVRVEEGRVAIGQGQDKNQSFAPLEELTANQELSVEAAASGQKPHAVSAAQVFAWRSKQLIFRDAPLEQVGKELERYYPIKISFAQADLAKRKITAVIQLRGQEETLAQVTHALGLHWEAGGQPNQLKITDGNK